MNKNTKLQPAAPFKAKLRHYHRTASPTLYSRKQKRWQDVSASELGDAQMSESKGEIDYRKLSSGKKSTD